MPRKGQKIKHRKIALTKPNGAGRKPADALDGHPLSRYMHSHFNWLLSHGYFPGHRESPAHRSQTVHRLAAERGIVSPTEITLPILERYQRHLFLYRKPDGSPLTLGTQHGCLAPLKTFFRWLAREHHILYNPTSELQLPKRPKRLPRTILSVQNVEAVLNEAEPITTRYDRTCLIWNIQPPIRSNRRCMSLRSRPDPEPGVRRTAVEKRQIRGSLLACL